MSKILLCTEELLIKLNAYKQVPDKIFLNEPIINSEEFY